MATPKIEHKQRGANIIIGIDPGAKTGIAVWNRKLKCLLEIQTTKIHRAIDIVKKYNTLYGNELFVRVEDARKRKWFGGADIGKLQGAGSIKRDCTIWEDFLYDMGINFEMIHPTKGGTKIKNGDFIKISGYASRTSNHGRDAAMLVVGY